MFIPRWASMCNDRILWDVNTQTGYFWNARATQYQLNCMTLSSANQNAPLTCHRITSYCQTRFPAYPPRVPHRQKFRLGNRVVWGGKQGSHYSLRGINTNSEPGSERIIPSTLTMDLKTMLLCLFLSCLFYISNGVPYKLFYPYGDDVGDKHLEAGDDRSSNEIQLRTSISFYSRSYTSIFVSNLVS